MQFTDLFIILPLDYTVSAEMYFTLRQRPDISRKRFIETAFDGEAYVDRIKAGEKSEDIHPEYLMPDLHIKNPSFDAADNYRIIDYIAMFFIFCFIGWVWEVGLHVVKDQMFVIDIICCNIFGPNIGEGIGKEYSARDNYRCAYAELPCPETDAGTQHYQP